VVSEDLFFTLRAAERLAAERFSRTPQGRKKETFEMSETNGCIVCKRTSQEIPLVAFQYMGKDLFICPQHLPTLIHDPAKLAGLVPGAEGFEAADHKD
jgi:hypothetical protein